MTGQTGQTGQTQATGSILRSIMERFAPPTVIQEPIADQPVEMEWEAAADKTPASPFPAMGAWADARAAEVQAVVLARVEQAIAEMPENHPSRQPRTNVLSREPLLCRRLAEVHDPMLWDWAQGLECMLARWREQDRLEGHGAFDAHESWRISLGRDGRAAR